MENPTRNVERYVDYFSDPGKPSWLLILSHGHVYLGFKTSTSGAIVHHVFTPW